MFSYAFEKHAIDETYDALLAGVPVIRPGATIRAIPGNFVCFRPSGLGQRQALHFFVRKGWRSVSIYCSHPTHPYRTVLYPFPMSASGRFVGRLFYTNRLTGTTVETLYCVEKVWWLHGLPRNIENGLVDPV
jgi:hypothetical protein